MPGIPRRRRGLRDTQGFSGQKSEVALCGSAQAVSAIKGQRAGGPGCAGCGARWRC
ncbi:protein of unknown function [Cupriavidus taiwanensis]|uniref:Uncharacterized protein n=1 Tax=Cupriavidus taiwanensis TaxID=164546 RepID=A0A9Q7XQZ0_9BURK|nr:protein of unknown function [Cupriavidus taiwanensis]